MNSGGIVKRNSFQKHSFYIIAINEPKQSVNIFLLITKGLISAFLQCYTFYYLIFVRLKSKFVTPLILFLCLNN
jgi:hypothetical protein